MNNYILGISCLYHDSAATLIRDGEIIAAVQEERFSRKKNDSGFPTNSIKYCLDSGKINLKDLSAIIYYEKPLLTFERLLETYLATAPKGFQSFVSAMKVWLKDKLFLKSTLRKEFELIHKNFNSEEKFIMPKLLFSKHHLSHAASAFYPSPYKESAILCLDAVGEWVTTSAWIGQQEKIEPIWEINFPHSIGLLYSAFTYYCGFKVNSGEYKLMGLAPYGNPIYVNLIKEKIVDIRDDGSFHLDMTYFEYHYGLKMTSNKFHKLFGNKPRQEEDKITKFYMDIAASIQEVTEEIILKLAKTLREESKLSNLCLSGGVALNCVANGKLLKEKIFKNIWIQPASGDAGSSLGCALLAYYNYFGKTRKINKFDSMKGCLLGPSYSNQEIINYLDYINASYLTFNDQELFMEVASLINDEKIIGWFTGPMEFGPRALGGRSIIGDPRNINMQEIINLKIKYRESFRPFAPSVLKEDLSSQFELNIESPYMLFVANINKSLLKNINYKENQYEGLDKLKVIRSEIPAITHVNNSARIQTVSKRDNPRFYKLIKEFKRQTNCPLIINTSFNIRGEPIVCSYIDAFRCFMRTEMDVLVLENQLLFKKDQINVKNTDYLKKIIF